MKKYSFWLLITLVVLLVILMLTSLYQRQTGSSQPLSISQNFITPLTDESTTFTDVRYVGTVPSLPDALPSLKIQFSNVGGLHEAIVAYCQITESQDIYYYGQICNYNAYDDGQSPQIILVDQQESSPPFDEALAEQAIETFLATIYPAGFMPQISLLDQTYLSGSEEFEPLETSLDANASWMFYTYTYQGIPILAKNDEDNLFSFIINANQQILKAELKQSVLTATAQDEAQRLISIKQALANIGQGQAYLSLVVDETGAPVDLSLFSQVELQNVRLEYRYNEGAAIPMYHFLGSGLSKGAQEVYLDIITPAINFSLTVN